MKKGSTNNQKKKMWIFGETICLIKGLCISILKTIVELHGNFANYHYV